MSRRWDWVYDLLVVAVFLGVGAAGLLLMTSEREGLVIFGLVIMIGWSIFNYVKPSAHHRK